MAGGHYYKQYKDLYHASQSTGKYQVFLFDVKGSREHFLKNPREFNNAMQALVTNTTADLLQLEEERKVKILHRHLNAEDLQEGVVAKDKVVFLKTQKTKINYGSIEKTDQLNPLFSQGDLVYFIINRDSISTEEFMSVFQRNKDATIPNYDLHYKIGYYETDIWENSHKEFSRIYCIPVLEELCKDSKQLITTKNTSEPTDRVM